jgi:hypothetical protein
MAIARLTKRYVDELAMVWWRRDKHPVRSRGSISVYADIDSRILSYCSGAELDIDGAYRNLIDNANLDAEDFPGEVGAGLLLALSSKVPGSRASWLNISSTHDCFAVQRRFVTAWLSAPIERVRQEGLDRVFSQYRSGDYDREVVSSQSTSDLRFLDVYGRVRGYFVADGRYVGSSTLQARDLSIYCSELVAGRFLPGSLVKTVVTKFDEPADVFLALGVAGSTSALPWLLEQAGHPSMTALALDSVRRITGYDVLEDQSVENQARVTAKQAEQLVFAVKDWLSGHQDLSLSSMPLFLGQPINSKHLWHVLRFGPQAEREIAAMRLQILHNASSTFPVRANVFAQEHAFSMPYLFGVQDDESS